MDLYNFKEIYFFTLEPDNKSDFDRWASQDDVVTYLENEATEEYIIIYASLLHSFIHSIFIPKIVPNDDVVKDLKKWSYNPFNSWGLTYSSDDVWIEPPLSSAGSELLQTGEQIVFGRSFEGLNEGKSYFELNQKLSHVLGVHFIPERSAWCKLDGHGDILEVFKVIEIEGLPKKRSGKIICAKADVLEEYLGVQNLILIRMFDFTRYRSGDFLGWNQNSEREDFGNSSSIFGYLSIHPGIGSYSRGFQLVNLGVSKEEIIKRLWGRSDDEEPKQYCSYIAYDWKNRVISEISCDPKCLANYFTESDLPYEITPAFFKPEVLSKYKSDNAKYKLETRSISCRGAWHLKTFDINSAGQVHTYLIYLSQLPYEEQLHWKQYNERPKAPISERAVTTDFMGQFYKEYDPLPSLKHRLEKLHSEETFWWLLRDGNALNKVHYPYTDSKDEWADEILNLDQLLVEGFEEKWLRKRAKELGCNAVHQLRSLKLIETILIAYGFEEDYAREVMSPFHVVHHLRSILKGHTSGKEAEEERKNALKEFGSFRKHFEKICSDCDESLEVITETLKEK